MVKSNLETVWSKNIFHSHVQWKIGVIFGCLFQNSYSPGILHTSLKNIFLFIRYCNCSVMSVKNYFNQDQYLPFPFNIYVSYFITVPHSVRSNCRHTSSDEVHKVRGITNNTETQGWRQHRFRSLPYKNYLLSLTLDEPSIFPAHV